MSDYLEENKNSSSLKAWQRFTDDLNTAGETIIGQFGAANARERAEGFRYLTRLLSIGLDLHLEHADPQYPTFTRMINDTRKFIGDNPDATYDYASLSCDVSYLITGQRGISDYLGFCLYGVDEQGKPSVGANAGDDKIQFAEDGSFELYIAKTNDLQHTNFLAMDENTNSLVVRQYFTGDRSQAGTYAIKAVSTVAPKAQLDEAMLSQQLKNVSDFVEEISTSSSVLSIFAGLNAVSLDKGDQHEVLEVRGAEMDARGRPSAEELAGKIDPASIALHMPTPDIQYSGCWWELAEDEAVVISGKKLDCRYWSIQIFSRWMESPDYRYNQVSINNSDIIFEEDGSFKVYLCAHNPGFKNWISTDGFHNGQVCFRALLADEAPEVHYQVEKIDRLLAQQ